ASPGGQAARRRARLPAARPRARSHARSPCPSDARGCGWRGRWAAVLLVAAIPAAVPAKPVADVCNEAENSWQGGSTVTGGPGDRVDPNPPARLRGSQMRLGAGLVNAAEHSPALRLCGPTDGGGGDGGGPVN